MVHKIIEPVAWAVFKIQRIARHALRVECIGLGIGTEPIRS